MGYLDSEGTLLWLQAHLEDAGIGSLSQLARISGINKGTLSKYFNHLQRPTIDVVAILCKSLGVTPSELLYGLGAIDSDSKNN